MVFAEVFQPFIEESPVSVMFRGTLDNIFRALSTTSDSRSAQVENSNSPVCCLTATFSNRRSSRSARKMDA